MSSRSPSDVSCKEKRGRGNARSGGGTRVDCAIGGEGFREEGGFSRVEKGDENDVETVG